MIKIVARQVIREEAIPEFVEICKELVAASVKDPGNVFYTLNVNTNNPAEYVFIECWEDQESIQNHMAQPHFQKASAAMADMLASEPTAEFFAEVM